MTIIQCKNCGANLNIKVGIRWVVCEYCGTSQSLFDDGIMGSEDALLRRAFLALEDGDFEKADSFCEQALNISPENSYAYLGKLRAELKLQKWEDLKNCPVLISTSTNYRRLMQFADESLKSEISKIVEWNKDQVYKQILALIDNGLILDNYNQSVETLKALNGYQDSEKKLKEIQDLYEESERKNNLFIISFLLLAAIILLGMFSM